jgi:hypothetical protein
MGKVHTPVILSNGMPDAPKAHSEQLFPKYMAYRPGSVNASEAERERIEKGSL